MTTLRISYCDGPGCEVKATVPKKGGIPLGWRRVHVIGAGVRAIGDACSPECAALFARRGFDDPRDEFQLITGGDAVTVEQASVVLAAGDEVMVTLFAHAGEEPWVLLSVVDADESPVPTVSLTVAEAAELREVLRKLLEEATRVHVGLRR